MSPISIPSNILIDALNTKLESSTAVWEHVWEMSFLAEIRTGFNGDSNALGLTLLGKLNSFFMVGGNMTT